MERTLSRSLRRLKPEAGVVVLLQRLGSRKQKGRHPHARENAHDCLLPRDAEEARSGASAVTPCCARISAVTGAAFPSGATGWACC